MAADIGKDRVRLLKIPKRAKIINETMFEYCKRRYEAVKCLKCGKTFWTANKKYYRVCSECNLNQEESYIPEGWIGCL